jgi:hypothetical protein
VLKKKNDAKKKQKIEADKAKAREEDEAKSKVEAEEKVVARKRKGDGRSGKSSNKISKRRRKRSNG